MFKFDKREFKRQQDRDFKERLELVKFWCDYIKRVPNKEWSSQQAELINSQITKDMIKSR